MSSGPVSQGGLAERPMRVHARKLAIEDTGKDAYQMQRCCDEKRAPPPSGRPFDGSDRRRSAVRRAVPVCSVAVRVLDLALVIRLAVASRIPALIPEPPMLDFDLSLPPD